MKKNRKTQAVILFALPLMIGCKHDVKNDAAAIGFSMSDTMMAKSEFATAQLEQVKSEMRLFGKITADNSKQADIVPVVGGSVIKVHVELGDYVQQGQVLATVRSSEVAGFQKDKLDAQSDLALAEKNLQVAKDMFAGKLASEKEVIAAEKEYEKARAASIRINEIYNIYSIGSGSVYNIKAPISGFIVSKNINQNEQLRSDKADPFFSIAQIDEVWVLANVNESDIGIVKEGVEAEVTTVSYPDRVYKGRVDKIFNAIDPQTKAMKVRIRIPNSDLSLKPEMNATVKLLFQESKQMLAVPSTAIIFDKNKNWVMVFKSKSNIETRQVEVYQQLGNTTYVSSGLNEGESVISKNGLLVYDALND